MRSKWLYLTALSILLGFALAPSLAAQPASTARQSWTSPEEFRTEYLKFIDTLSAHIPESDQGSWAAGLREKISEIRQQVSGLSDPAVEQFSKMTNRRAFTRMAESVAAGTREPENKDRPVGRFRTLGAIASPDYAGAVAGTTCSTTPTDAATIGKEKLGSYIAFGLQVPLDYACKTFFAVLGEGTNLPFCILAGVAKAAQVIVDSLVDHQEFCNGLLDGAKADAAFNDVVDIHGDVEATDTHLTNVDNHVTAEFVTLDAHLVTVQRQGWRLLLEQCRTSPVAPSEASDRPGQPPLRDDA
ncbi:MAG: hypothetical protein LC780_06175 [Acidobacteria bacterium]|nr:hypothetical protein [Acidobacteriota bacterium]